MNWAVAFLKASCIADPPSCECRLAPRSARRPFLALFTGLPKRYLQELVTETTFDGEVVRMQGRNAALLAAAAQRKMGTAAAVPISVIDWCPEEDSNLHASRR